MKSIFFLVMVSLSGYSFSMTKTDSLVLQNVQLQKRILELELYQKISDSVTVKGSPILIEKISAVEKSQDNSVKIVSSVIVILVLSIGFLGWGIFYNSDRVARVTAKDEFNKNFKEYHDEIQKLLTDSNAKYKEIQLKHELISKVNKPDLESIKRRSKNG